MRSRRALAHAFEVSDDPTQIGANLQEVRVYQLLEPHGQRVEREYRPTLASDSRLSQRLEPDSCLTDLVRKTLGVPLLHDIGER